MANEIKVFIKVVDKDANANLKKFEKSAIATADRIENSFSKLNKFTESFLSPRETTENLKNFQKDALLASKKVETSFNRLNKSVEDLIDNREIKSDLKEFEDSAVSTAKRVEVSFSRLSAIGVTFLGNLAANAVTGAFSSIRIAASNAISTISDQSKQLEDIRTQFTTLTGSIEDTEEILQDLLTFSAKTPFQLQGIASAAKQLLSFGFDQDVIIEKLQQLGDVAAASGSDLQEISLIFGQVSAAGKLTGERLLQLQERAIPIGPAIAKTLGIAESQVREFVSKGRVDFATFERAFASLSERGGQFFQGMSRQSRTASGVLSTFRDVINITAARVGQQFLPLLKSLIIGFTGFIEQNSKLIESLAKSASEFIRNEQIIPKFISNIAVASGFIGKLSDGIRIVTNTISIAFTSVKQILIGILFTITDIIAKLSSFAEKILPGFSGTFKKAAQDLSNAFSEAGVSIGQDIDDIKDAFKGETFSEVSQGIQQLSESVAQSMDMQTRSIAGNTDAVKQNIEAKQEQKQTEQGLAQFLRLLQEENALLSEEKEQERLIAEQLRQDERIQALIANLTAEEQIKARFDAAALIREGKSQEALKKLRAAAFNAEIKQLQEQEASKGKLLSASQASQLSSQSSVFGEISRMSSQFGRKTFFLTKAFALAEAATQVPLAANRALAAFPPPVGAILAGVVTALGVANVARIAAQSPPSTARDGLDFVPQDNMTFVASRGERIVDANTNRDLKDFLRDPSVREPVESRPNVTINVMGQIGDSEETKEALFNAVADAGEFQNVNRDFAAAVGA